MKKAILIQDDEAAEVQRFIDLQKAFIEDAAQRGPIACAIHLLVKRAGAYGIVEARLDMPQEPAAKDVLARQIIPAIVNNVRMGIGEVVAFSMMTEYTMWKGKQGMSVEEIKATTQPMDIILLNYETTMQPATFISWQRTEHGLENRTEDIRMQWGRFTNYVYTEPSSN